ncbi:hypothetical protein BST14_08835 [Mycobacterium arosiense ATCC BAA-1401 = DSM 45069]|uniref:DUF3631 domain-containing protein n=2 Tax=Mycobacterium arosiense TaxID=425468 RepID=A0A1W9ZKY5_MYCAI|nr:hypothetical protein BST14_08835 [Mycobacterium arosiense ATCC BAA-1401 = DSM 45069]
MALGEVDAFLSRFIAYPSDAARHAHVLWIAHTHRMDEWDTTPRLAFISPEKGSGKTRALEVSEHLVPHGIRLLNTTAAFIIGTLSNEELPTLFCDEIDTIYGPNAKGDETLRAVLNGGYKRGAMVGRASWDNGLVTKQYPSYGAVALAGIGGLPDTIADRAIVIRMQKRKNDEHVEPWRERINGLDAKALATDIAQWMEKANLSWPDDMPVTDRAAEVWEPLIMVADAAGGEWPARARAAAVEFTQASDNDSTGVQLLKDIKTVFGSEERMHTRDLLRELLNLPESRWRRYYRNNELTDRDLAKLLKQYDVISHPIRIGDRSAKGYIAANFSDAWSRYTYTPEKGQQGSRGQHRRSEPTHPVDPDVNVNHTRSRADLHPLPPMCSTEGCGVPAETHGLCGMCHAVETVRRAKMLPDAAMKVAN